MKRTPKKPGTALAASTPETAVATGQPELVIITGMSGSGKGTVLKALEDLGYYSVDNLPIELLAKFAGLTQDASNIRRAALVVDVREGEALKRFPAQFRKIKKTIPTTLLFLEADDDALLRRFSETRRPHPLGAGRSVTQSIMHERRQLNSIQALAQHTINTSKFNVHDLRGVIAEMFGGPKKENKIVVYVNSFGFKYGVPSDSDLVFDVRFLPNPNYIPEFKKLTGNHPSVARYIRSFPQTTEFIERISALLIYLLPHYIREGKSYLTISFGCTGGHHRSVMIGNEIRKRLAKAGYGVKGSHRDVEKS